MNTLDTDNEAIEDAKAMRELESMASGGYSSTLDGAEAAAAVLPEGADDSQVIAGKRLRQMTLSDYLLLIRRKNTIVGGRDPREDATDSVLAVNLYAALEVLFVATSASANLATRTSALPAAEWESLVSGFGATIPAHELVSVVQGAVEYVSRATETRVSAKSPTTPGASAPPGND